MCPISEYRQNNRSDDVMSSVRCNYRYLLSTGVVMLFSFYAPQVYLQLLACPSHHPSTFTTTFAHATRKKLEPLSLCNISNSGNASSYRLFSAQAKNTKYKNLQKITFLTRLWVRESYLISVSCVWSRWALKSAVVKLIRDINAHAGSVATMHLHVSV